MSGVGFFELLILGAMCAAPVLIVVVILVVVLGRKQDEPRD